MAAEKLIGEIVSQRAGVSEEEIQQKLESERRKTGGLISDETLLRIIAAGFGIDIQTDETSMPSLSIIDLVPSLNNVTLVGRVVAIFPPRAFNGRRSGKIASLLLADKSGILRVVFWNDNVALIESENVKVGQITRFSHGYTKEGRGGSVELHVGEKCQIENNPADADPKDFPDIGEFASKIGDLVRVQSGRKVNVLGRVKEVFPVFAFERQDSTTGKVMRFVLIDETGEVPVVVWNAKADELEKILRKGIKLQMADARVKNAMREGFEIHVDTETYVGILDSQDDLLNVAELKEGLDHVSIEGEIVTKPLLREVRTSRGETVKLATFESQDKTGKVWVSAWRKHADVAGNLSVGDRVLIRNAYVKKGFGNQIELTTREATEIVRRFVD